MKRKSYLSPEFEMLRFDLESIMAGQVHDSYHEDSGSEIDDSDEG